MVTPLNPADLAILARADSSCIVNALARFRTQACPPWLPANHPYPNGAVPTGRAGFAAVAALDMVEVIAVRGPLHAVDGWGYLGRALSALLSGQAHAARHLAYYAELRAAQSILASSGIGIFNRRNAVIDSVGAVHIMSERPTHEIAWLALTAWCGRSASLERLITPIQLAGASLLVPFREFFPAQILSAARELMFNWGFDLRLGAMDREQRNLSSYQPTVLTPLSTTPAQDADFLTMFWGILRPNGVELERQLFRILLETEARSHGLEVLDYESRYERLMEGTKAVVSFDFLTRVDSSVDHDFIIHLANKSQPAPPYAMLCRAGLLLRLATGMAEENLRAAGVQPVVNLDAWWQDFGVVHGLWAPGAPPGSTADLWHDIDLAIEDVAAAPTGHRHEWLMALGGNAMQVCQAERAALWGLIK
jgi:hypothetical protein